MKERVFIKNQKKYHDAEVRVTATARKAFLVGRAGLAGGKGSDQMHCRGSSLKDTAVVIMIIKVFTNFFHGFWKNNTYRVRYTGGKHGESEGETL